VSTALSSAAVWELSALSGRKRSTHCALNLPRITQHALREIKAFSTSVTQPSQSEALIFLATPLRVFSEATQPPRSAQATSHGLGLLRTTPPSSTPTFRTTVMQSMPSLDSAKPTRLRLSATCHHPRLISNSSLTLATWEHSEKQLLSKLRPLQLQMLSRLRPQAHRLLEVEQRSL
jgi:hypothetical protein